MLTQLVQQLSRFLPRDVPSAPPAPSEARQRGRHESAWPLAQGADAIELPAPVAASWFPDTQPSFRGPSE
jgi:hypothetical protein